MKIVLLFLLTSLLSLSAQTLEPRLYSNIPTDFNFVVTGYTYSKGALPDSPALNDSELNIHAFFLAYARGLNIFSKSAKVDVAIPSACLNGNALYLGKRVSRDSCGVGDIKTRLSINLFGAPATALKDFAAYKQDWIFGVSLQGTLPTGKYKKEKLVNIGSNRWALKAGMGLSKRISNFVGEIAIDAEVYTNNDDFLLGKRKQDAIFSTQLHLIYNLPKHMWIALDTNYYFGGENTLSGVKQSDELENSRTGLTFALPLSKSNSLKFYGSKGIFARAGSSFDTFGIVWQYRFADGF